MTPAVLAQLTLGATLSACALAVAGVLAYASGRARRRALLDRLSAADGTSGAEDAGPYGTATGGTEHTGRTSGRGAGAAYERRRRFTGVDRRLRGTRHGRRLHGMLAATGLDVTAGEFAVYVAAGVAGLWLVASAVLAPFFGPLAGLAGLLAAHAFLVRQRERRTEQFINQLPELSRILANATSAGLALRTALGMAAEELDAPAGDELTAVVNRLAVGASVEDALGELAERLPSRELAVLVTTLVLANRAGGTIVGSLRNLTSTLEERKETRREVRTMLAEVNATAFTVPVLGVGAMLLMNTMMAGALARVTGSPLGQLAMLAAVGLFVVGFFVIRRLGRIEV